MAMIATIFDLWTTFLTNPNPAYRTYYWIVQCISFITMHILPMLFCIFIIETTHFLDRVSVKTATIIKHYIAVPYLLEFITIILTPFLSKHITLIFTLDENNQYIRGSVFFSLLYFFTGAYFFFTGVILFLSRKKIPPKKFFFMWFFIILILGSVGIQFVSPRYLVQCYGISLGTILLCCFVQTPEDYIDGSTNLFNLNSFILYVSKTVRRNRQFNCISVVINDTSFLANTYGVNRLNTLFSDIGTYLTDELKKVLSFSIGQGQFCLIVKNQYRSQTEQIINDLLFRFNRSWIFDGIEYKITPTICTIDCPSDAASADDIIAITTLISEDYSYTKKIINAKNIDLDFKKRSIYVEHALQNAIEQNRFSVFYQPIYSTHEKKIIGAEAIIRLMDHKERYLYAEEFLPIAEKTGNVLAIGEYTFNSLCNTLSEINTTAYGIKKINVNLSVAQCMQENLAAQLLLTQEKYHIPASLINLEITETAASQRPENLLKNMEYLSAAGITLTLDNFGAGYSNLDYLLSLPFRVVKINKSLIKSAYSDIQANKALSSIISMIHGMGMTVMADGIETPEQAEWLTNSGCDFLQGPFYSKPIPKEDFLSLMAKINQNFTELKRKTGR